MPIKPSKKELALPSLPKELIDEIVSAPLDGEAINAAAKAFEKARIERALGAESAIIGLTRRERISPSISTITVTARAARRY